MTDERKCSECGGPITYKRAVRRYDLGGLPDVVLDGVEVGHCKACGAEALRIPKIGQLHRLLASVFVSKPTPVTPTEIKFLRKHGGLSTSDFADYMSKSRETISRWENGKTPMGASAERLLRLLVVTKAPIADYSVDVLKEIKDARATGKGRHAPLGLRMSHGGWKRESQVA